MKLVRGQEKSEQFGKVTRIRNWELMTRLEREQREQEGILCIRLLQSVRECAMFRIGVNGSYQIWSIDSPR